MTGQTYVNLTEFPSVVGGAVAEEGIDKVDTRGVELTRAGVALVDFCFTVIPDVPRHTVAGVLVDGVPTGGSVLARA